MECAENKTTKNSVLIIGFNRPQHLEKVIQALPQNQIQRLHISIDGPRNRYDQSRIELIKEMLLTKQTTFPITAKFQESNLGCSLGVISALDWFFTENERGLVLEDDCIPHPEFFEFVNKHKEEVTAGNGIGMISAHNPLKAFQNFESMASNHSFINGWYSTSEIWQMVRKNIFTIQSPLLIRDSSNRIRLSNSMFWWATATRARLGTHDTWDSPYSDNMKRLKLKCIVPGKNLITNIGFGQDATHTQDPNGTIFAQDRFQNPVLSPPELDTYLDKNYFGISKRHAITPLFRVIMDRIKTRSFNQEEILSHAEKNSKILVISGHRS